MKVNIDLSEPRMEGCCAPLTMSQPNDKRDYPTFTYSKQGDDKYEFPEEGTMTVRFRKSYEATSTNEEGESKHSCTFELHEIVSVTASESSNDLPKNRGKETEDALDSLAKARKGSKEDY